MPVKKRIISLLTDFGVGDAYVGAMKGVMLGICPRLELVDITHEVEKYNVSQGAFILSQASPYFPEGSIHLAVVEPGVGTFRRRIIIQGLRCKYVGPDNGVLSLATRKEGIVKVVEIKNETFMLPHPSKTFEGRDIFAPVAAHLATGIDVNEFGPEIDKITDLSISKPESKDGEFSGEVIHIDGFGNITTNILKDMLGHISEGADIRVAIGRVSKITSLRRTYGEVPAGSPVLTVVSSGFIEVAVNKGSAKEMFKAKTGDKVILSLI